MIKLPANTHVRWHTTMGNILFYFSPYMKPLETQWCKFSIVATEALVQQHQAISIHSADCVYHALNRFRTDILHLHGITSENKIKFRKKYYHEDGVIIYYYTTVNIILPSIYLLYCIFTLTYFHFLPFRSYYPGRPSGISRAVSLCRCPI